jgi:hypothetical protein
MVIDSSDDTDVERFVAGHLNRGEGLEVYHFTALEQDFFLHLLSNNREHVNPKFQPPWDERESDFKLSFFIPIARLRPADVARLSRNSGCVVCGKSTRGVCDVCEAAQYCGRSALKDLLNHILTFLIFP